MKAVHNSCDSMVIWSDTEDCESQGSLAVWSDNASTPKASRNPIPIGGSCGSAVAWNSFSTPDDTNSVVYWTSPESGTPIASTSVSGPSQCPGTPALSKTKNPKKISFLMVQAPDNSSKSCDSSHEGSTIGGTIIIMVIIIILEYFF